MVDGLFIGVRMVVVAVAVAVTVVAAAKRERDRRGALDHKGLLALS
uniref:Uncharacterized protein n=1 Tax=Rhizophora mucronata TaxID=61149 RepID=A0A2P2PR11_RHIMU